MTGEPTLTIVGNLTADPEVRYTQQGTPVASFNVASTPRTVNRQTKAWEDGETLFMRCNVWRDAAENVGGSLRKGQRVIVVGRLVPRSYTARDGSERRTVEMQVDEVGPSLRYARAQVQPSPSSGGRPRQEPPSASSGWSY